MVVSLANRYNVSSEVSIPMITFTTRWVQSASQDLDVIAATAFPKEWARMYMPVLSNHTTGHILYTKHLFSQPDGQVVLCPSRCNTEFRFKEKDKRHVRFDCDGCGAHCTLTSVKANLSTLLRSWDL